MERLGVAAVGDRAKLLEASQRMKETMPEVVAAIQSLSIYLLLVSSWLYRL